VIISSKTILQSDIGGLIRALDQLLTQLGDISFANQVVFLSRAGAE
jgi:hypothetical protein